MRISPAISPLFLQSLLDAFERGMGRDEAANGIMALPKKERSHLLSRIDKSLPPEKRMHRFLSLLYFGKARLSKKEKLSLDSYFPSLTRYDREKLKENPYYRALTSLPSFRAGELSFEMQAYEPFVPFVLGEKRVGPLYEEVTPLGYVAAKLLYPALRKGKTNWMEVIPHEIATMEEYVTQAKGDILLYGLGLGYVAYMCGRKKEVTSLTIIEQDPDVIEVFQRHFLPLFPDGGKLRIIEGDALAFAAAAPKGAYDSLFADLWHNADDGLPLYQKLLKAEGAAKRDFYWIEQAMLAYFRRFLILLLVEEGLEQSGDEAYLSPETASDAYLCKLHFALKEVELRDEAEVLDFLSESSLRSLLRKLD